MRLTGCVAAGEACRAGLETKAAETSMKILIVIASHHQLGDTDRKTGFWLEEFAALYAADRAPLRISRKSNRDRAEPAFVDRGREDTHGNGRSSGGRLGGDLRCS